MRIKAIIKDRNPMSPCCQTTLYLVDVRLGNPDDQADAGQGTYRCLRCQKIWRDDLVYGEEGFWLDDKEER